MVTDTAGEPAQLKTALKAYISASPDREMNTFYIAAIGLLQVNRTAMSIYFRTILVAILTLSAPQAFAQDATLDNIGTLGGTDGYSREFLGESVA